MSKKNKKHSFDLITPADSVDYDPLDSKDLIKNNLINPIEIIISEFKDDTSQLEDANYILINNFSKWNEISEYIKKEKKLNFDYLMCITSYDLEADDMIGLAYNFYSTENKNYLEVRIEFKSNEKIFSVANIWRAADWHEREAYDLMGVIFEGHPDMKRILLPDDWDGHPLRKDWKEPEYYNGMPVPKDKTYWE